MKNTCYTHISLPAAHLRILSNHAGKLTLVHAADSTTPGAKVFNAKLSDLRTCNCGRWKWTAKNRQLTPRK